MRLSDAVIHGSGDAETGEMNEETATAEQYLGQSEEENQVFAFIEGIPSKEDKKRDAMIRLWIIPQKMLFFQDFPTLSKVLAGEEFEKRKGKSKNRNVNYASYAFADNYKRLIGARQKYLQALYQTRYGRANKAERKKIEALQ